MINRQQKKDNSNNNIIVIKDRPKFHWGWIIAIVVLILFIIGYLHDNGYLNINWQFGSIFLAALAAPYTLIKNFLTKKNKKVEEIDKRTQRINKNEHLRRAEVNKIIEQKEKRIAELEKQVDILDEKIQKTEYQRRKVKSNVNNQTDKELNEEFSNLFH